MKIKVASYNVFSGRTFEAVPGRSYDFSCEVIRDIAPDIIGLNEVGTHAVGGFPPLLLASIPFLF